MARRAVWFAALLLASLSGAACASPIESSDATTSEQDQLETENTGIADYGPQSFGANGNQRHWNTITPNLLCVTIAAGFKSHWVGHTIYVKNPDGKVSSSVVVEDWL